MLFRDLWHGVLGSTKGLEQAVPGGLAERAIVDTVVDSRTAGPGTLFVALAGERTDGHLYIKNAFEQGAVAALAGRKALELDLDATYIDADGSILRQAQPRGESGEASGRPEPAYVFVTPDPLAALQDLAAFWRGQMAVSIVGITGSVGKTTTKEMVASVLGIRFNTLRSEGNFNNEVGLPLTLLHLTPAHQRAVLEMGMYDVGEITRLCAIARPRIGVVTNVGPVHLERLGTIERIAQAKAELVQALPPEEDGGVAVLNYDDPLVIAMRSLTRAGVITYGLDPGADLWADDIVSEGLEGIGFCLHQNRQGGKDTWRVRLDVLGRHSVHTALRAAAVGQAEGLSWPEIITGLRSERGNLRLMVVPGLRETTLIDDTYNASPVSMLAALHLLEDVANADHRAIAVLGDMLELGAYEEEGHRVVGGRAARVADKLIAVGRRARIIAEEALASGMAQADVYPVETNEDAVAILQGLIRKGDIVLVKGSRGQKMEGIVDALSRPREVEH